MDKQYFKNMAASFANQQKNITIPTEKLGEPIFLGFQPLGIASTPKNGYDLIAIADYYAPAICLAKVRMTADGLEFFDFEWIRGVNHGIQSVRLFPDVVNGGDINRAQTVNFGHDGTLWVSRSADPERSFFVLSPPENSGDKWSLTDKIQLPKNNNMAMIHSANILIGLDTLHTIESSADLNEWRFSIYTLTPDKLIFGSSDEIKPFTYGIAATGKGLMMITDFRSEKKHGIYRYSELAVPDVFGNGVAVLSDGSVLITVYGQACPGPFNGQPGMLLYISKDQLEG